MELYWSQFGNWVIVTTTGIETVQGMKTSEGKKKKLRIKQLFYDVFKSQVCGVKIVSAWRNVALEKLVELIDYDSDSKD